MKIVDVKIWTINVPYTTPFQTSFDRRTGTTRTVLRLTTDNGLIGWGESFRGRPTAAIIERSRDMLIGWNPYDVEKLRLQLDMTPFFYGYVGYAAMAAIEMACYDLMGKETGKSLAELTGGMLTDKIKVTGVVTPGLVPPGVAHTPDALAEAAALLREQHGFSALKLKGSRDAQADVQRVRAVRRLLPDVGLRIDPNAVWSVPESILAAQQLLPLGLEYLEDPCKGLEGMARVRATVGIPLCTNMCVVRLEDFAPAMRLGAVDVIHGDVHKWGGISAVKRLAALCDAFGIGLNLHSGGELGISTACHLQLAASTPEIRHAIDTVYYLMADDIITQPFTIENGKMTVPTGPGLGIEVDLQKLEHYAAANAADGDLVK
ncbi:MAG: isomerase [Devosia sp.]|uniref:mandelate racemase/muconate lactonizing enzyme family protein n=1 Tax=Devosia sp. TaxID=1871048 RepID=UPI00260A07E5|nr:enolase C-terminal domain-like protein [Devosia sp.]MDB5529895.1 isomerase [Devosia sp.]